MPHEPNPLGPALAGADEMPVLLGAGGGQLEALLLVGRPDGGRVRVREWTGDWSAPPRERVVDAQRLLAEIEDAQRAGRRVNQELYAVRLWLSGAAR